MSSSKPKFVDSPYFINEPGNWRLKKGAPVDVQKEFDAFMLEDEAEDIEPVKTIKLE